MAKKEVEETYVSGEQYRSMHPSKRQSSHQVTLPVSGISVVIIIVVLCVLSFIGGMQYQKGHGKVASKAATAAAKGFGGQGFSSRHRMGGFGQVTAISSTSITITSQRTNASTTYTITSSTAITDNGQAVTTSDIQTGDTVVVGTSGSSSTATSILVNPSFGGGQGQTGGDGSGTSQSN